MEEKILSVIDADPDGYASVREIIAQTRGDQKGVINTIISMRRDNKIVKAFAVNRDGSAVYRRAAEGEVSLAMPRDWNGE